MRLSRSQMGHGSSGFALPQLTAARSSSGWASHTSVRERRPFRYSDTMALRAKR